MRTLLNLLRDFNLLLKLLKGHILNLLGEGGGLLVEGSVYVRGGAISRKCILIISYKR